MQIDQTPEDGKPLLCEAPVSDLPDCDRYMTLTVFVVSCFIDHRFLVSFVSLTRCRSSGFIGGRFVIVVVHFILVGSRFSTLSVLPVFYLVLLLNFSRT